MKVVFYLILASALASVLLLALAKDEVPDKTCVITRIVDGDTFHCDAGGEDITVRIIGVDTPELPSPEGVIAKEYVEELLPPGTEVRLELDVQTHDRYRRLLTYAWLKRIPSPLRGEGEDGGEEIMINELLLREGYAQLMTIPPNVKYVDRLTAVIDAKKQ